MKEKTVTSILILLSALPLGCATTESVRFDPAQGLEYPARPSPAVITRDSEKTLTDKGYVKLGTISITDESQVCENNSCSRIPHDVGLEMRVQSEAAKRGGDVVRIEQENVSGSSTRHKKGDCIAKGNQTVYITERECSRYSSTGWCSNWRDSGYRTETQKVCTQWADIPITTYTLTTSGTVWRNESERIASEKPYIQALTRGSRADVERFISQGASIGTNSLLTGQDPLLLAELAGNVGVVELLLDKGAKLTAYDFTMSANAGQAGVVNLLLRRGAAVNEFDSFGYTALHRAISSGHIGVVKILLDNGADVNAADKINDSLSSPLHWAAKKNHAEMVKLLLDRGADIDGADGGGATALMYASVNGHRNVIRMLLDRGAKIDHVNRHGDTALGWASIKGKTEAVKLLAARGSNVNNQNNRGMTGLMWAADEGHLETVKAFLALGAEKGVKNGNGKTAAEMAKVALDSDKTEAAKKPAYREIIRLLGR